MLKIFDVNSEIVLYVKRKRFFGFKWTFLANDKIIATFTKNCSIMESITNKSAEYILEFTENTENGTLLLKYILAVIVTCRHGYNRYSYGR